MEKQRYKLTEVARMMGISPETLRRQTAAGKIPAIKDASGRIYFPAWWVEQQLGVRK